MRRAANAKRTVAVEQIEEIGDQDHISLSILEDRRTRLHKDVFQHRVTRESETIAQRDRPKVEAVWVQRTPQRVNGRRRVITSHSLQTQLGRDKFLIELLQR